MIKIRKRLVVSSIVILCIAGIFVFSSYLPSVAIRKYLFFSNPMQALTCQIVKSKTIDTEYGQMYVINGFTSLDDTHSQIGFAYLKKNYIGLYSWASGGTGP